MLDLTLASLDMVFMPALVLPIVAYVLIDQWDKVRREVFEAPRGREFAPTVLPASSNLTDQIEALENLLPYQSWIQHTLSPEPGGWRFEFKCNSLNRRFYAAGNGKAPVDAFLIAKHHLLQQISDWHCARFKPAPILAPVAPSPRPAFSAKVLIIDDDVDLALAMQKALGQLGCETVVETRHESLHRKIISCNPDYILMDWKLSDQVTAGDVMAKTVRVINAFSDLRRKYSEHKPRLVTYSVLDRDEIQLPPAGGAYFNHMDHWQKPMPFSEVISRASSLLSA